MGHPTSHAGSFSSTAFPTAQLRLFLIRSGANMSRGCRKRMQAAPQVQCVDHIVGRSVDKWGGAA